LAGFIEPGGKLSVKDMPNGYRLTDESIVNTTIESIEDAVRREVMEEAGIKVGQVR
jgi:8-oxo-dGTP pyrophosphatase MutT (NUDIX family)